MLISRQAELFITLLVFAFDHLQSEGMLNCVISVVAVLDSQFPALLINVSPQDFLMKMKMECVLLSLSVRWYM